MALGSDVKRQTTPEELDELLEGLEKLMDRTKVLYEQYFMGIQKIAPMQLHRDIERKVRELTQQQIRNTGLRFRFTTLCQKFGSYNTYWKRTLREIEQGKYVRDLARVKRKAEQAGEELPEELLVKLPKLIQDRIRRDRAKLAERARRDEERAERTLEMAVGTAVPATPAAQHEISEEEAQSLFNEGDLDLDGLFTALTAEEARAAAALEAAGPETPPGTTAPPPTGTTAPPPSVPGAKVLSIPLPRGIGQTKPAPVASGFRVPPPPGARKSGTAPPPRDEPAAKAASPIPIQVVPARPEPARTESARPEPARPESARPEPRPESARPEPRPESARPESIRPEPRPESARPEPRPESARPEPRPEPARTEPARVEPIRSGPAREPGRVELRARTQPPVRSGPPLPPGMDDRQCRELYTRYLKARQLVGEKNDDVTYEKLVSSLGKQAAAIMSQHGARGVEFNVVVRGDKVVLKAKPLKTDK